MKLTFFSSHFEALHSAMFFPIHWKIFLRGMTFCCLYIASDTVVIVWKNQGDACIAQKVMAILLAKSQGAIFFKFTLIACKLHMHDPGGRITISKHDFK